MKLSIESFVLAKRFGISEGLDLIKKAGFDCVDMSYYWMPNDFTLLSDNYKECSEKTRQYLDTIGLECNQAHAPFNVRYGEEFSISNPHYLEVVRSIESASILGAKTIVVHAIDRKEAPRFDREYNLAFYKSLRPYSEKFNINIAIENLKVLTTPDELSEFILELDSPCFVACVDVGHAAFTGTKPEEFCAKVKNGLLKAVHIQDGDYIGDCHIPPYMGRFDWMAILKSLKEIGYDGELTFEVFNYLSNYPNDLIFDALCFAEKTGRSLISAFEKL